MGVWKNDFVDVVCVVFGGSESRGDEALEVGQVGGRGREDHGHHVERARAGECGTRGWGRLRGIQGSPVSDKRACSARQVCGSKARAQSGAGVACSNRASLTCACAGASGLGSEVRGRPERNPNAAEP